MIPLTVIDTETTTERWLPGAGWRKRWRLGFNWCRISVRENEKSSDGGDGCTAQWVYLVSLNCTFKIGQDGEFHVNWTDHNLKK